MAFSPRNITQPHALQHCWDLQLAALGADALQAALACDLFSHLGDFTEAGPVAARLGLDATNTGYCLELLWCQGLLERDPHGTRFRNLPVAEDYLRPQASRYCGDALQFRHRIMRHGADQFAEQLRNGTRAQLPTPRAIAQGWAQAARVQIAQEQRAVTAPLACELLQQLPEFASARRLLDLGGGPGLVAIALAEAQPQLHAVVFDYAEAADVARDNIAQANLAARVQAVGGDLNADELGGDYDLIWCSSVLHFVPDIPALLARLYRALRPGGVLLCSHAELPHSRAPARRVLPYYLHMRMQGRQVLGHGVLAGLLGQAGFDRVEQVDEVRCAVAPVNVVIGRKACGEAQ